MTESKRTSWRRKSRKDESGSIEGLPLQLMIMGIIASLGTAVVVGWVSSIETPIYVGQVETDPQEIAAIDDDGDGIYEVSLKELRIKVLDTGGNPIGGAGVLCEGASLNNDHHRLYGVTDEDGALLFSDVSFKIVGDRIATVKISISGQGVAGDYWTELVVLPS